MFHHVVDDETDRRIDGQHTGNQSFRIARHVVPFGTGKIELAGFNTVLHAGRNGLAVITEKRREPAQPETSTSIIFERSSAVFSGALTAKHTAGNAVRGSVKRLDRRRSDLSPANRGITRPFADEFGLETIYRPTFERVSRYP